MPENRLDPEKVNEADRRKRRWWHWLIPFVWRDTYERTLKQLHIAQEMNSALGKARNQHLATLDEKNSHISGLKKELSRMIDLEDENQRLQSQLQEIGLKRGADGKFKSRGEKV